MRSELKENNLIVFLEGELNSYNAEERMKEIESAIGSKKFSKLILDFSDLTYISSAGLRVLLRLRQKYGEVAVVEASLEVYDVLSMTGFTNMMSIKKALKRVDVTGAEIVGEGYFSTVYRIDKDTIIKVFNRVSDPDQIERELKLAKEAFVLGIPTAISFDIVKVNDKLGVRFEMLDCASLKDALIANPDKYEYYVKRYVELLKTINTTECFDPEIPSIMEQYRKKVDALKTLVEPSLYEKVAKVMDTITDTKTLIHGDCHFKNIMVQGDELLIIDMDTLAVGHPIFEFAAIYAPYCAFDEDDPGNSLIFFGVPDTFVRGLFLDLVKGYFGKEDEDIINKIRIVSYVHMLWWTLVNQKENTARIEGTRKRLKELLERYDNVDID